MTLIIRCVFSEDGKFYSQLFLDNTLYELNIQKNARENSYKIHFQYMSKDDAINIMNGSIIWLIKVVFCKFFLLYIEMGQSADLTYYQKNRDLILNKAKDFYKNTKERPREQVRDKYRSLSEEEKNLKKENMGRKGIIICLKKKKSKD